jgi:hypothetical protein
MITILRAYAKAVFNFLKNRQESYQKTESARSPGILIPKSGGLMVQAVRQDCLRASLYSMASGCGRAGFQASRGAHLRNAFGSRSRRR